MGFLYCFVNEAMLGFYKIGFTDRTIKERLTEANKKSTWLPYPFKELISVEISNAKEIETMVHKALDSFRVDKKEFFKGVSEQTIFALFNFISQISEIIPKNTSSNDGDMKTNSKESPFPEHLNDEKEMESKSNDRIHQDVCLEKDKEICVSVHENIETTTIRVLTSRLRSHRNNNYDCYLEIGSFGKFLIEHFKRRNAAYKDFLSFYIKNNLENLMDETNSKGTYGIFTYVAEDLFEEKLSGYIQYKNKPPPKNLYFIVDDAFKCGNIFECTIKKLVNYLIKEGYRFREVDYSNIKNNALGNIDDLFPEDNEEV